jgi:hypothetical protein
MRIQVKNITGRATQIDIAHDATGADLKRSISRTMHQLPPDSLRLIFEGQLIQDDAMLSECNVKEGATVNVVVAPAKPSPPQEARPSRTPPSGVRAVAVAVLPAGVHAVAVAVPVAVQVKASSAIAKGRHSAFGRPLHLCGAHGKYLQATPEHHVQLHSNKLDWETWQIEDAGGGHVFVCGPHGKNLGASDKHRLYLHTNKLGWEKWRIEDAGDGCVFLCGANGRNLGASDKHTLYLHTNKLGWEKWRIALEGGGTLSARDFTLTIEEVG